MSEPVRPASSSDAPDGVLAAGVLAVDSGGSGLRATLAPQGGGLPVMSRTPVRTGPDGIDPAHLMEQLVPMARQLMARTGESELRAVAIGAAGMASLGDALRAELPTALEKEFGTRRVALAADAVTAYVGALGPRRGAVVAGGTGLIALGTDLTGWHRADGWGHLLGDCGSGAWIGRAGLEAAMRAHDGRRGGSAALLARAEAVFGPAPTLPGRLYPRSDRPAVLASFAQEVAAAARGARPAGDIEPVAGPDGPRPGEPTHESGRSTAPGVPTSAASPASDVSPASGGFPASGQATGSGDPVAAGILQAAAEHIAEAATAVCPGPDACDIAFTGGLFRLGEALLGPLREALATQCPQARLVPAAGDPLDGAVRIAADLAEDRLRLPQDGVMLYVSQGG